VGVGASAGGLDAFTQLLKHLPADTGMAFVLIQHLDPGHTSFLREALAKSTEMPVSQAEDGTRVEPNHVYVIPPRADIAILGGRLTLTARPQDSRASHLPVDFFLRALAAERGSHAIGVILSGTASDGTDGLKAIKAEDGITFAQDPKSAKFPGMPRSAIDAGVVDYCLAIPQLAEELVRLSRHPYVAARQLSPPKHDDTIIDKILAVVRSGVGVNFSEYKAPTLHRRLARRMALRRVEDLDKYLTILRAEPDEVRALYEDVLIHVTSFFRDPEVFDVLKTVVLPEILKHKPDGAPIRVWVAGCSTGEEVYSVAIALLEFLGESTRPIQIFGSDVSENAIEKARAGLYPDSAIHDMSDERRRRFFTKVDGGNRVIKSLRDMCVFVEHDLARDPPFAKLDLVSCRNVLIYFDQALQKRVLPTFHYALSQPGYLLLGRTESISGFGELFSPVDASNKIFARTAFPSTLRFARRSEVQPAGRPSSEHPPSVHRRAGDLTKHLDRLLLARYAPPGVVVNSKMDILQFRGLTGSYLQPAPGEPQNNIIKMARGGLLSTLRATIAQARKQMAPIRTEGVEVDQNGYTRTCDVVVVPFTELPDTKEHLYIVLFEEGAAVAGKQTPRPTSTRRHRDPRVAKLEHELAETKDYLSSLVAEQGRTNDELGTVNEELVSGNEELQSMNEELETAKEELQSTNEELTTVNDELHHRNQEMAQVNSDLVNVLGTVDIPILILDMERRIRRYTPNARSILNVLPTDVGRPLDDIKLNIAVVDLDRQIAEVIDTMAVRETEVRDHGGRWYRMQIRPYRTTDNRIDGAILSLVDIDALKHHISEAQQARLEAERANRAKDQFLATLSHELRTPLATMLMHAELLRQGGMDDSKLRRAGEAIERGTRMQVQLIEDLLDVSRIVAGKLKLDLAPVHLGAVVRTTVDSVSALAQRKSIDIQVVLDDSIGPVSGDAVRLQQIVSNLLTNAIKFTPDRGHVSVVLDQVDGQARLRVSDTGVGIEPAFLPHVFHRFAQEDNSSTRNHGGLGLGLAIVRHLVELHGGTVHAESPGKGHGATLSVMLPLMMVRGIEPDAGAPVADGGTLPVEGRRAASDSRQLRDLRILVIDDDPAIRDTIAEMLQRKGAVVMGAASAEEAMASVEAFEPEVLLCDIAMPGEDGYTFIRRLRSLPAARGGDTPAVALTALAGRDDYRRALAAGFQLHLTKPIDMDRLIQAIAAVSVRRPSLVGGTMRSPRQPG
jgi:two-component system CheB/CheR fusion protein